MSQNICGALTRSKVTKNHPLQNPASATGTDSITVFSSQILITAYLPTLYTIIIAKIRFFQNIEIIMKSRNGKSVYKITKGSREMLKKLLLNIICKSVLSNLPQDLDQLPPGWSPHLVHSVLPLQPISDQVIEERSGVPFSSLALSVLVLLQASRGLDCCLSSPATPLIQTCLSHLYDRPIPGDYSRQIFMKQLHYL